MALRSFLIFAMTSKALSLPLENEGGDIHVPTNDNTTSSSSGSSQSSIIVDCSEESINELGVASEQIDNVNGSENLQMQTMSGENHESSNGSNNLKASGEETKVKNAAVSRDARKTGLETNENVRKSCLDEVGMQQDYVQVPKKNDKNIIFLSDDSSDHSSELYLSPNDKKEDEDTEGSEHDDDSLHNGAFLENNRRQNRKDSTYTPRIHGEDNELTQKDEVIPDHNNMFPLCDRVDLEYENVESEEVKEVNAPLVSEKPPSDRKKDESSCKILDSETDDDPSFDQENSICEMDQAMDVSNAVARQEICKSEGVESKMSSLECQTFDIKVGMKYFIFSKGTGEIPVELQEISENGNLVTIQMIRNRLKRTIPRESLLEYTQERVRRYCGRIRQRGGNISCMETRLGPETAHQKGPKSKTKGGISLNSNDSFQVETRKNEGSSANDDVSQACLEIPVNDAEKITVARTILNQLIQNANGFKCTICLEVMKNPVVLPECMHRFCETCVEKSLRKCKHECPNCRCKIVSRRDFRKDLMLQGILEKVTTLSLMLGGQRLTTSADSSESLNQDNIGSYQNHQTAGKRKIEDCGSVEISKSANDAGNDFMASKRYRKASYSVEDKKKVESELRDKVFFDTLQLWKEFVSTNGTEPSVTTNTKLHLWQTNIRTLYKNRGKKGVNLLSTHRMKALVEAGFVFDHLKKKKKNTQKKVLGMTDNCIPQETLSTSGDDAIKSVKKENFHEDIIPFTHDEELFQVHLEEWKEFYDQHGRFITWNDGHEKLYKWQSYVLRGVRGKKSGAIMNKRKWDLLQGTIFISEKDSFLNSNIKAEERQNLVSVGSNETSPGNSVNMEPIVIGDRGEIQAMKVCHEYSNKEFDHCLQEWIQFRSKHGVDPSANEDGYLYLWQNRVRKSYWRKKQVFKSYAPKLTKKRMEALENAGFTFEDYDIIPSVAI